MFFKIFLKINAVKLRLEPDYFPLMIYRRVWDYSRLHGIELNRTVILMIIPNFMPLHLCFTERNFGYADIIGS